MDEKYSALFTPWKIGNVEIPNRIVQCSMGGTSLFGWLEPCHFDKEAANFLLTRAKDGVGLVLPGMQCVRDTMGRRWLYQNKKMFKELADYMVEYHKTGSKLFIQLAAGFGRSMAVAPWMVTLNNNKLLGALARPVIDVSYCCASASATPNRWQEDMLSRPMTVEEIHEMVDAFGKTAKLLREAGVDGVEIHAVHEGYLLDQFTIANWNHRTDEYGGSFENRFRFPVEIVQEIKRQAGADFPVSLRYSVVSKTKAWGKGAMPYETDFEEFGRDMAESEKAIKYLGDAGYDMFNCDNGTYDAWYWAHPPQYMPDNCNLEYVEHIKKFTNCPVVCAGRMDPVKAAEEIAAGRLDAVAIARQNLVDHEWVHKILEGREDEIKPCIRCHNGCFNFAKFKGTANIQSTQDSLHLGRCALNPTTMQHNKYKIVPTKSPKKVAIIGGGPTGIAAAYFLGRAGVETTIFEREQCLGGVPRHVIPAFRITNEAIQKDIALMEKYGVEVRCGAPAPSVAELKAMGYTHILYAVGAWKPGQLGIPGDVAGAIQWMKGVKAGNISVGGNVAVVGAGNTAMDAARLAKRSGAQHVTIVYRRTKKYMPADEHELALALADGVTFAELCAPVEQKDGVLRCEKMKLGAPDEKGRRSPVPTGEFTEINCDTVIAAVGERVDSDLFTANGIEVKIPTELLNEESEVEFLHDADGSVSLLIKNVIL